jgi:hypothetical protein
MILYVNILSMMGLLTIPLTIFVVIAELDPLFVIHQSIFKSPGLFIFAADNVLFTTFRLATISIGIIEYGRLLMISCLLLTIAPVMLEHCIVSISRMGACDKRSNCRHFATDIIPILRYHDRSAIIIQTLQSGIGMAKASALLVGALFFIVASFVQIRLAYQLPIPLRVLVPGFTFVTAALIILTIRKMARVEELSRDLLNCFHIRSRMYGGRNYKFKLISSRRPLVYNVECFGYSFKNISLSLQFSYFFKIVDYTVAVLIAFPI